MAMQMSRAFNAKMLVRLVRYRALPGSYNETNDWIAGKLKASYIRGVIVAGNKFSQFEEGIALKNEDGGVRFSDYRTLYVKNFNKIDVGDKIKFNNKYFNVVQTSDEEAFGFKEYLLEKSENWTP